QRVEALRTLEAVRAALKADGDALLDAHERAAIVVATDALERSTAQEDHRQIKDAIDALAKATEEFAARRMNRSVAGALTGKRLDEVKFA
ncbi:MAG: Fe-S protein assembly chaperone HscA, partial [Betaproteobacteria bacterium]|nr:Fe-S protein assembly chaperone HscA [Betaproteobacteria bacterium]